MSDVTESHRKRQAAYAAKNRRKAKALRRPDARAIADAYMAAVEDARLINLIGRFDEHIAISHPGSTLSKLPSNVSEERARAIVDFVRILVQDILRARGFDDDQIKDKMTSMICGSWEGKHSHRSSFYSFDGNREDHLGPHVP